MSQYNPLIHHRKSIRLKGYDYSQAGLYFITICCQNHTCLFGEIINDEMVLIDAGKMVEKWYYELEHKYKNIICDVMVVMPNHFHCIIEIVGADLHVRPNNDSNLSVGADLCVCPNVADLYVCPNDNPNKSVDTAPRNDSDNQNTIEGEHKNSPLYQLVQWFKTMTTNEYIRGVKDLGWERFDKKVWQRNYYEHIIRNQESYINISNYIINNPSNWQKDKFYKP